MEYTVYNEWTQRESKARHTNWQTAVKSARQFNKRSKSGDFVVQCFEQREGNIWATFIGQFEQVSGYGEFYFKPSEYCTEENINEIFNGIETPLSNHYITLKDYHILRETFATPNGELIVID